MNSLYAVSWRKFFNQRTNCPFHFMFKSVVFSQFSERLHHKTMKPANPLQLTCPTDQFYNYRPVLQTNLTTTDQSYLYRPVLPLQTNPTSTDQSYHYRPVLPLQTSSTDQSYHYRPVLPLQTPVVPPDPWINSFFTWPHFRVERETVTVRDRVTQRDWVMAGHMIIGSSMNQRGQWAARQQPITTQRSLSTVIYVIKSACLSRYPCTVYLYQSIMSISSAKAI